MLHDSIVQMPALKKIEKAINKANFEIIGTKKYAIQPDLQDKFLYCGKHNPAMYFEEAIRHGISSFSALANKTEVENGLADLRKDIDSGEIEQIMQSYENDLGDYLYIIGKKL